MRKAVFRRFKGRRWTSPVAAGFVLSLTCFALRGVDALAAPPARSPDGVTILRDVKYRAADDKHCSLDLALPTPRGGAPRPAIVVIHGGGWIEGDKSSFASDEHGVPGNIVEFSRLGFVAATINYRLSGTAPFPAALDDCQCAVRFLRAHADDYHIDAERIGAYGNSAGGHLALLLGLMDQPVGGDSPPPVLSSRVQAVVSDSGPLDLVRQHQQNQLRGVIEGFMGGPPVEARLAAYRRASPASHVSGRTPPLLLIYGVGDEQVDVKTADDFVTALGRGGRQDTTYVRLAEVGHCPHSLVRVPCLREMVDAFFVRTLRR